MTRSYLKLGIGVAAVSAAAAPAVALAASGHSAHSAIATHSARQTAKVSAQARLTSIIVSADRVTVTGSVALSPNTAAERSKLRVVIKLDGGGGYDRYVVAVTGADTFSKSWTTSLYGSGKLDLRAEISSRYEGTDVIKAVTLPAAATTTPTTTTAGTTSITTTTPTANEVPLVGTFEIGSGSTFEMFTPGKLAPVPPGSLTLTAGTDGGLETFGYQPGPDPGFDSRGNALADRIIKPLPFDGINFTVDTQPTDVQTRTADPVPTIEVNAAGQISGQVTAWDAQWNNQNFNQGSPKPDVATQGSTTAVSGTYDWATGAYTITWQSLIVNGPFNNFVGVWHLAGTFDPATF